MHNRSSGKQLREETDNGVEWKGRRVIDVKGPVYTTYAG